MVLKRGAIPGYDIAAVRSMDGMTPIILDFMQLVRVILALLPCLMTTVIGNRQGRILVCQLALETLREMDWSLNPNDVRIFLKWSCKIRER